MNKEKNNAMKIQLHSITIRATVIEEPPTGESPLPTQYQRTFTPDEEGLPGWITEMFSNATRYLHHNAGRGTPPPSGEAGRGS